MIYVPSLRDWLIPRIRWRNGISSLANGAKLAQSFSRWSETISSRNKSLPLWLCGNTVMCFSYC